jgi:hypothetical protein
MKPIGRVGKAKRAHDSIRRVSNKTRGRGASRLCPPYSALAAETILAHIARMTKPHETPVMEPFPDKEGTGWHVIIRYHEGHERRIEGFASKAKAVDWINANATQVDE